MKLVVLIFLLMLVSNHLNAARGDCRAAFYSPNLSDPSQIRAYTKTLIDSGILTYTDFENFFERGAFDLQYRSELLVHQNLFETLEELYLCEDCLWLSSWLQVTLGDLDRQEQKRTVLSREAKSNVRMPLLLDLEIDKGHFIQLSDIHVTASLYTEVMQIPLTELRIVKEGIVDIENVGSLPIFGLSENEIIDFLNSYSVLEGLPPFFRELRLSPRRFVQESAEASSLGFRLLTHWEQIKLGWNIPNKDDPLAFGWFYENARHVVQPVATLEGIPIQNGIFFDVKGNVRNVVIQMKYGPGDSIQLKASGLTCGMLSDYDNYDFDNIHSTEKPCGFRIARTVSSRVEAEAEP